MLVLVLVLVRRQVQVLGSAEHSRLKQLVLMVEEAGWFLGEGLGAINKASLPTEIAMTAMCGWDIALRAPGRFCCR